MARERERSKPKPKVPDTEATRKQNVRRWIVLTYRLIEHKIMYYYPEYIKEGFHPGLTISDYEYETLEKEYLRLCLLLGKPNTVSHAEYIEIGKVPGKGMLEVDFKRPVVHLVMRKWGIENWQERMFGPWEVDETPLKTIQEKARKKK